jgi:hypothetical protein
MYALAAWCIPLEVNRAPICAQRLQFNCHVDSTEAEITGAEEQMFARPIRIAAAVVIVASSVSTAAYASDASPTSTPSASPTSTPSASPTSTPSASPTSTPSASPNQSDLPQATRQSTITLDVAQPAATSDSNLRSSIATQSLPTLAITAGDLVLARTTAGAKFVATKLNALTYFWNASEMSCLNSLWSRESHWNFKARNYRSGAYGIPQANPGTKMASAGRDWRSNPITQIKWGMSYVNARYGSPCGALTQSNHLGWY